MAAKLVSAALASLDGFVEDADGRFDWAAPDEQVHAYVNDLERSIGTYLYGRRMYETMVYWETAGDDAPVSRDYAELWRATDKVVYSRTLADVGSTRTRIEREFDADVVRTMKASASADISIGGAELAGQALATGLVDEVHLFLAPVLVGRGKRALPVDARLDLELLGERRFDSGFVHLHYRVR